MTKDRCRDELSAAVFLFFSYIVQKTAIFPEDRSP